MMCYLKILFVVIRHVFSDPVTYFTSFGYFHNLIGHKLLLQQGIEQLDDRLFSFITLYLGMKPSLPILLMSSLHNLQIQLFGKMSRHMAHVVQTIKNLSRI